MELLLHVSTHGSFLFRILAFHIQFVKESRTIEKNRNSQVFQQLYSKTESVHTPGVISLFFFFT